MDGKRGREPERCSSSDCRKKQGFKLRLWIFHEVWPLCTGMRMAGVRERIPSSGQMGAVDDDCALFSACLAVFRDYYIFVTSGRINVAVLVLTFREFY